MLKIDGKVHEVRLSGDRLALFFRTREFVRVIVFAHNAVGLPVQIASRRRYYGGH